MVGDAKSGLALAILVPENERMGTYTTLYLDDMPLFASKSRVNPALMTVFVEGDRRTRWRRADDGQLVDGPIEGEDIDREDDYVVRVNSARQRLDIMGFTLARCEREFEEVCAAELDGLRESREENEGIVGRHDDWLDKEIVKYEALTFSAYSGAFKSVFERKLTDLRRYAPDKFHQLQLSDLEKYILDEQDEWPHGFFCDDVRTFLRVALQVAPADSELRQDVSELVDSGWVYEEDPIRDDAVRELLEHYPENAPRIVLTEGSSDAAILEQSLRILYPGLATYYTFFDFHGAKAAGGASQLVSVVKAFAAAGVANRIIAILDNDTAAYEARRALRDVQLPKQIAVLHYPHREWLQSYPTIGPAGEIHLDVNWRAGNLEMYLGRDVLTVDGELERVQWNGYSQAMRAYQGELVNKGKVTERWYEKASRCMADPARIVDADWEDLRAVWQHIFNAFAD